MIKTIKARMNKNEEDGFTLIELLVVVLILGILMAIAIPTFLSLTSGAKQNAAEADLTTAAQDEATYFTTNGYYGSNTNMATIDPGITWVATVTSVQQAHTVYTNGTGASGSTSILLQTAGADGNYYWIADNQGAQTYAITTNAVTTAPNSGDYKTSWSLANKQATIPAT
jgi:type IV pilus assembly protein PilA